MVLFIFDGHPFRYEVAGFAHALELIDAVNADIEL